MQPILEFTSPDSPTIIYVCGHCRLTAQNEQNAILCCACNRCGKPKKLGRVFCEECDPIEAEERRIKRAAELEKLPIVEDTGQPVFLAESYRYYSTLDDASEAIWDDEGDFTQVAHPCDVVGLSCPDLVEYIEERWSEEFEDSDGPYLSTTTVEELRKVMKLADNDAPTTWHARTKERVVLPVITSEDVEHVR